VCKSSKLVTCYQGGMQGMHPPTRPKEMLSWHVISLKIIAKTFLYCTLLNHYKSQVHSYGRVSCSDELAVHTCPLLCLQKCVAIVARRLFYCWSSLCKNSMATNLQRFTLYYRTGVLLHDTVERTHLGSWCSETVTCW